MAGRKSKQNGTASTIVEDAATAFRLDYGERLRWLLDQFDTRAEAGEVAGVTPEHLPAYIAGRAKPRFEAIAKLAAAKNVSLDWIATGNGARTSAEAEPDGYVAIAVQAEAGARFGSEEDAPILFSRAWLRTAVGDTPPETLRMVVHRGNANEPVIRDGELLLVDTSAKRIVEDGLYVFLRDGKYLARFVETFIDGRVALKARNPDYGTQPLTQDEAARLPLLGRVLWRGGAI